MATNAAVAPDSSGTHLGFNEDVLNEEQSFPPLGFACFGEKSDGCQQMQPALSCWPCLLSMLHIQLGDTKGLSIKLLLILR